MYPETRPILVSTTQVYGCFAPLLCIIMSILNRKHILFTVLSMGMVFASGIWFLFIR
jgi:hypothetical protein